MSRPTAPSPRHRRPNPVLVTGVVSLTLTLVAGWWFVLRPPERSAVALCGSLSQVVDLDERLAHDPHGLEEDLGHLTRAVEVAPPEIEPDVRALAEAVATVRQEAVRSEQEGTGPTVPVVVLRSGMARLEPAADELSGSSRRVVDWAGEHCGLHLGESAAAAPAASHEVSASRPGAR